MVGKVALVTGGSRGLGAEIARALAEEGADVTVSYVSSAEKAAAVVRHIEKKTVGYSKAAARDLAPRNITVNVTQAGLMDTDMFAPFKEAAPALFSTIAIQRYAKLEEVAVGVVFFASPAASYITGAVIDIEGGYSA